MATGPLAGLPVWGTGGLTVITRGALTGGATSTQANGFFGAALKYSGYDAIVMQGQAKKLSYLYINDDVVEVRDAAHLRGKDTWETQQALETEHGLAGHRLSVYAIGPAGENLVRFAAIHGDYGHVASKNGCGAVMGKKKLKAVCIVRGTKALAAHDTRGLIQAADDIAHDLKTDPSTLDALQLRHPARGGESVQARRAADQELHHQPDRRREHEGLGGPGAARRLRPPRAPVQRVRHCANCHIQIIPKGRYEGERVDEPEYEGWSGAGWTIGLTDKYSVSWLNTRIDRACVDVNEFGWVCGWVMECMEKGYLTEKQVGFRLTWGDVEGSYKLLQMISHRQGFGDILAEGVKRASEKIGGKAAECAIYTMKGASPRGHDHRGPVGGDARHLHLVQRNHGERQPHVPDRGGRARPHQPLRRRAGGQAGRHDPRPAALRGFPGRLLVHFRTRIANLASALSAATGWDYRLEDAVRFGNRTAAILRAFNLRCGIGTEGGIPVRPVRLAAGRRPREGARRPQAVGPHARRLVRDGQLRPQDRQAQARPAALPRPALAREGPLRKEIKGGERAVAWRFAAEGEPSAYRSHHVGDQARRRLTALAASCSTRPSAAATLPARSSAASPPASPSSTAHSGAPTTPSSAPTSRCS